MSSGHWDSPVTQPPVTPVPSRASPREPHSHPASTKVPRQVLQHEVAGGQRNTHQQRRAAKLSPPVLFVLGALLLAIGILSQNFLSISRNPDLKDFPLPPTITETVTPTVTVETPPLFTEEQVQESTMASTEQT